MKKAELRKAVQVMPEEQIISLFCLYDEIQDRRSGEDEGGYAGKVNILQAELDRRENPAHQNRVDEKLSRKPGFWVNL